MIPRLLRLSNFFSYRDATLDFSGLNTACICGENGAGKSSLLEAISWSVWGKTRASSEDEIISIGERETRVDFTFESQGQGFRIVRSRRLGQASSLEFQVETPLGFRAITAKGTKATQKKILETLNLDYETFINSAYLRQGRADEFMLKRPNERKKVLADLLKLDRYEVLAKRAREVMKQAKVEAEALDRQLEELKIKAADLDDTAEEIATTEDAIAALRKQQQADTDRTGQLRDRLAQRQGWQQRRDWLAEQLNTNARDRARNAADLDRARARQIQLAQLLDRAPQIEAALADYERLSRDLAESDRRFYEHQQLQTRRHGLATQLDRQLADTQRRFESVRADLDALDRQLAEAQKVAQRGDGLTEPTERLTAARDRLKQLDLLQTEVAPLEQRRQQLDTQRDRLRVQLESQRDRRREQIAQLSGHDARRQKLTVQLQGLADSLGNLENKQVYFHRVQEKGVERRSFLERLQAQESECRQQIEEFERKVSLLDAPDALCPLCDRPLDGEHWQHVSEKHARDRKALNNRLWLLGEQIATARREIDVLRQEYRSVQHDLKPYDALREKRGQLQAQLEACQTDADRLAQLQTEADAIATQLDTNDYAPELQAELQSLEVRLEAYGYDDRDRALVRSEVDSLRWVDIERAKVEQAERTVTTLNQRRPELVAERDRLSQVCETLPVESEFARDLADLDRQLADLAYSAGRHNELRQQVNGARGIFSDTEALEAAREEQPRLAESIAAIEAQLTSRDSERQTLTEQQTDIADRLAAQQAECPDPAADIATLDRQMQERRAEIERQLSHLGRLQQQSHQLEQLNTQIDARRSEIDALRYRQRLHAELDRAFGKNGLQALTIETVLPQLEAETNRLLARLSGNQLHVQFVTQKARKRSRPKSSRSKTATLQAVADAPIETLEIFIADTQGTRAYETYSGGEAFRINFSIRLALSRLLAQRSGASLQLLIVDEGFGTQDERGRERLVSAIEAISSDFACILAVTHIPSLKEAFQTRIEVTKSSHGSQIQLVT